MTQIDEFQSRISRALDRIAQGVEGLSQRPAEAPAPEPEALEAEPQPAAVAEPAPADDEEIAALREALDEERLANAQLEERNKVLNARLTEQAEPAPDAAQQEQLAAQREMLADLDAELQRLRASNDMLRETNQEMRAALEAGVGEPHLINQAMLAELEGLRATRAAESSEARAVLSAIEPLLAANEGATGEAM
ncbi:hypothetical protein [Salipiger mucosus]|uniref:Uncharacterized protein n=1 Tax=Salipiger mucosus DSM 16094 TaxID=1123237 RepID=S9QET0_9RHOB|nr:hypothetical protein [Salipiger mucosus]EPX78422.1 hypothetical protein Salmuc_03531 [Salipiger mucosus DSM 16094]